MKHFTEDNNKNIQQLISKARGNTLPSSRMFYLIGLGLADVKDVTVKGLEIIKKCSRVYLEAYTSILSCGQAALVGLMDSQ